MQTVNLLSDVDSSVGCLGYSVIRRALTSARADERLTLWFIRDNSGFTQHALILPAERFQVAF